MKNIWTLIVQQWGHCCLQALRFKPRLQHANLLHQDITSLLAKYLFKTEVKQIHLCSEKRGQMVDIYTVPSGIHSA